MKLKTARLCVDCESIYDLLRSLICGLNDVTQCPECGSHSTMLLSTVIPTMAADCRGDSADRPVEAA
jgi:hypothetical protein